MNPLIAKLEHGAELSDEDRAVLEKAISKVRSIGAREDLIREGDKPDYVQVIVEGFACRYKILPDGKRHIMAWLVPGAICTSLSSARWTSHRHASAIHDRLPAAPES